MKKAISSAAARALCPLEAALDGLETARHEDRVPLSLTSEFEGPVAALERGGAEYAVVGALAVAVHGAPRATTDIDLLVPRDALERVRDIARSRGFTLEALRFDFVMGWSSGG